MAVKILLFCGDPSAAERDGTRKLPVALFLLDTSGYHSYDLLAEANLFASSATRHRVSRPTGCAQLSFVKERLHMIERY